MGGHEIGRAFEICADRAWIRMRNGSDAGGRRAVTGCKEQLGDRWVMVTGEDEGRGSEREREREMERVES